MIKIRIITEQDYEAYDNFILSQNNTLFYQTIRYQKLLSLTLGQEISTIIALDSNNNIVGALPLIGKQGIYGKVFNSLPFYGSNGGIIASNTEVKEKLNNYYREFIQSPDVAIGMISTNPLLLQQDLNNNFDIIEKRNCQITCIENCSSDENLLSLFHYKTRNMIRKALKSGINYFVDNNAFDYVYEMHNLNMSQIGGIAKPKIFFDLINKIFTPGKDFDIWIAEKYGKFISAILLFYYKDIIEYYTPVIDVNYRNLQSNSLLIFKAMQNGALNGYKYWNWGGTWHSQTNLYRFKSRFGAKDYEYYYLININNKDILNSTKEILLNEYPYFYTVPFSVLNN
jgi:hypothetical protein